MIDDLFDFRRKGFGRKERQILPHPFQNPFESRSLVQIRDAWTSCASRKMRFRIEEMCQCRCSDTDETGPCFIGKANEEPYHHVSGIGFFDVCSQDILDLIDDDGANAEPQALLCDIGDHDIEVFLCIDGIFGVFRADNTVNGVQDLITHRFDGRIHRALNENVRYLDFFKSFSSVFRVKNGGWEEFENLFYCRCLPHSRFADDREAFCLNGAVRSHSILHILDRFAQVHHLSRFEELRSARICSQQPRVERHIDFRRIPKRKVNFLESAAQLLPFLRRERMVVLRKHAFECENVQQILPVERRREGINERIVFGIR